MDSLAYQCFIPHCTGNQDLFGQEREPSVGASTQLNRTCSILFFYNPKVKAMLKVKADAMRQKTMERTNMLTENQHSFDKWKIRMERRRGRRGEHTEGDSVKVVKK